MTQYIASQAMQSLRHGMRIISEARIREAKAKWPQAATALEAWRQLFKNNSPKDFAQLKQLNPAADKVGDLYVLDVGGNKIRIIVTIHFKVDTLYIRHILDHKEYDAGKWKD